MGRRAIDDFERFYLKCLDYKKLHVVVVFCTTSPHACLTTTIASKCCFASHLLTPEGAGLALKHLSVFSVLQSGYCYIPGRSVESLPFNLKINASFSRLLCYKRSIYSSVGGLCIKLS